MIDSMRLTCGHITHDITEALLKIKECISLLEIEAKNSNGKELEQKMSELARLQIAFENLQRSNYWIKKAIRVKS